MIIAKRPRRYASAVRECSEAQLWPVLQQAFWAASPGRNSSESDDSGCGTSPGKILEFRRNAPSSRQPLVKGERLVRSELGAAMLLERNVRSEQFGSLRFLCSCASCCGVSLTWAQKKPAAPKGVPERSPNSVLTGPCAG